MYLWNLLAIKAKSHEGLVLCKSRAHKNKVLFKSELWMGYEDSTEIQFQLYGRTTIFFSSFCSGKMDLFIMSSSSSRASWAWSTATSSGSERTTHFKARYRSNKTSLRTWRSHRKDMEVNPLKQHFRLVCRLGRTLTTFCCSCSTLLAHPVWQLTQ